MAMNTRVRFQSGFALVLLCLLGAGAAPPARAQDLLDGDLNADGVVNVLDVQQAVNTALGTEPAAPGGDVDGQGTVDVLDVQILTNTALGTGGLVQQVRGTVLNNQPTRSEAMTVIAISEDGRVATAEVSHATGTFTLVLPVRTSWSIGLFTNDRGTIRSRGAVTFPLAGSRSATLALPNLSLGGVLDLGTFSPSLEAHAAEDLRTLISRTAPPLDETDANGNGLPDILDELFFPLPVNFDQWGFEVPGTVQDYLRGVLRSVEGQLASELAACLAHNPGLLRPDLTGVETDGVPQFLRPLLDCLMAKVDDVVDDTSRNPVYKPLLQLYYGFLRDWLIDEMSAWLAGMGRPDLEDSNRNGIPDFLEDSVCAPESGPTGNCLLDRDRSGVADFIEDGDGDGVPNLFDRDWRSDADTDGDGIVNLIDRDDDNDGVPDYADAAPLDPSVS